MTPRTTPRPLPRRRARRHTPEEARRAILEAALRFLSRRPFRDLSVGELMVGAEHSRPAFYQYFQDLHELMESLLAELVTQIDAVANPWLVGKGDPEVALRESLRGLVQVGVEHGGILRAVAEAAPFDPRLERAWSTFMAHWDDAVCARIEAQQAQGLIPPFDARAMASALNRLDAAILIQAFGHRRPADPEGVLDTLHRIWASSLYGPSRKSRTGRRPRPSP